MNKILSFLLVAVPSILPLISCSTLQKKNDIALNCEQTLMIIDARDEKKIKTKTSTINKTYLINLKDKRIHSYTDTRITELFDVSIAPKSIYFRELTSGSGQGSISTEIDRETLKTKVNGDNADAGVCKKIPYPPMVSSKNKI